MKASVKWVVAALALSVATIVAVSQTAAPGHWRRGGMSREPMFGMFARQLDLTSQQRTQIHQILAKEKPAMQPLIAAGGADSLSDRSAGAEWPV